MEVTVNDEGPFMEMDGPGIWVPRTRSYREARKIAAEADLEPWERLRYLGKTDATLFGFTYDCLCEEVCERRYRNGEDTGDRSCEVPAWAFERYEP